MHSLLFSFSMKHFVANIILITFSFNSFSQNENGNELLSPKPRIEINGIQYNIGFSMAHLNRPKLSFLTTDEKMDIKYIVHGGMLIGIKNTPLDIVPSFIYAMQGPSTEILFGGMIKYLLKEDSKYTGYVKGQYLSVGAFYRNKDALIINALHEVGQMAFGISYDVNTSTLKTASEYKGGFEISLRFISASDYIFKSSSRF